MTIESTSKKVRGNNIDFSAIETSSKKVRGNKVAFSTFEITLTKVRGNNVDFSTIQIPSKRVRGNNLDFSTSKIPLKNVQGNDVDFSISKITSKKVCGNDVDFPFNEITSKNPVKMTSKFIEVLTWLPVARETYSNCNICHYVLVITLFEQVPDNNSLKKLLRHFLHHFGTICCCNVHDSAYRNIIKLIKAHLSFLKQHG